ncbi:MAG: fructose-bisphosphatase class III [Clostridia bacterium]|nr:fructose-bisphosphatase class III [Clostridia bacterium]
MTYVVANLHGELQRFKALLEKVRFSKSDILYVLGDTADYGADTAALLTELSMCENVYPIAGEHDFLALRMLTGFDTMLREGGMPDAEFAAEMTAWAADGGSATLEGFRALDNDMREGLLDYLSEFSLYEEVEVCGKSFVLVHAGICGFDADKELDEYEPADFFAVPANERYYDDRTVVVGHAPTASGRIEREGNLIRIDCGAKDGGPLACLCLETGEEYYI